MRYFICALDKIMDNAVNVGIPAQWTEKIIPANRMQTAVYETKDQEVFISLPMLFRQKDPLAPHGIVLKTSQYTSSQVPKAVLLTPRIDIDMEIPQEEIRRLPQVLAGNMQYITGVYFSGQNIILILNPENLMEQMQ